VAEKVLLTEETLRLLRQVLDMNRLALRANGVQSLCCAWNGGISTAVAANWFLNP
jgi:hypothetical protein